MKNVKVKAIELIGAIKNMFLKDISISRPLYQVVLASLGAIIILAILI